METHGVWALTTSGRLPETLITSGGRASAEA